MVREQNQKIRAIFPGKFNPPHIGHAKSILKLKDFYDLKVVVTTDTPDNAPLTAYDIAEEIWELGVDTEVFEGVLCQQETNPYPDYLVLSGNPKVIEWAKKVGAKYKFVPRSGNISGTQIRNGGQS